MASASIPTKQSVLANTGIREVESTDRGWRRYMIQDQVFEVPARYEVTQCIGKGAFGVVVSANIKDADGEVEQVAIKKVIIREDNILEVKRLVREVYLLKHFNHENIIALTDIIEPKQPEHFSEVYIACDLMDTDLHHIIRSQQQLTEQHLQFFLYQLLRGLKAIHSAGVLHRDLKPSNIVVNANCDLKICDFGLAREQDLENEMTDYVATRWYRAPELLMQSKGYTGTIDMWSVGCIFAEMLGRKPLFPGRNYLDQLHIILAVTGSPSDEDIDGIGSEKARKYMRGLKNKFKPHDLRELYPKASTDAIDLLAKMLVFDPRQRITAAEALSHRYFAQMHDEDDEPTAPHFDFAFDINDTTLTVFDLKDLIFKQLSTFHPECSGLKWWSDEEKVAAEAEKQAKIKKAAEKAA
eukprot:TRINITY_DN10905_c1_g1_i1.p1 TRINITY_DN10905_c1_g1~~TRINITY_DN10905_c1_g1_i1.p1  ORF type:complete len:411 (-),score=118.62 TRINITY_DN10905_c1_g1_i1:329-1561(-)